MKVLRQHKISRERKRQILTFISKQFNFEFSDLREALLRIIIEDHQSIVGHCALIDRVIKHNEDTFKMLFLGCMCTDGNLRNSGIGSALLEEAKAFLDESDYEGIILNCGESVSEFYRKCGFSQVSPKASYRRGKGIEVDNDPVFIYMMKEKSFPTADIVFLGEDF